MESVQIGLVYDVVRDELYHTIKGNGVYMNNRSQPLNSKSIDSSHRIKSNLGNKE